MKTWVISDADAPGDVCKFLHFWTERGLTTGAGRAGSIIEDARRCGWVETISVMAKTHREAVEKACAIFTKRRVQGTSRLRSRNEVAS